jgi:predicted DsbA family dithiol-disulfide isomerase
VEVEKARQEFDVRIVPKAFYLRPDTPPEGSPLPANIRARMKDPNNPLKKRAAELGMIMADHEVIPSTRRAHQAAKWAKSLGKEDELHEQILRHYWTLGDDIGQWPALRSATTDAGLDADAMQAAVESGAFQPAVDEEIDEGAALGIHAVPTYVLDDRHGIQGAQDAEVFRQAFKQLGAPRKK